MTEVTRKGSGSTKKSRKNQNKVRVRLPGIESYEKTLEFTAEGPGRVVVRLERLMGSDKIRITDPKYLQTLVERLEAEEAQSWGIRSRLRKKTERNRSRQLAIDGLMEPAEDMQDLYEHPVFRVNRVLNRLALFDQTMSAPGAVDKVPPIVPVEPFMDDLSGDIFRSYPQHQIFHRDVLPFDTSRQSSRGDLIRSARQSTSEVPLKSKESIGKPKDQQASMMQESESTAEFKAAEDEPINSTKSLYRSGQTADDSTSKKPTELNLTTTEEEEEEAEVTLPKESLKDFRKRYGVPSDVNLVKDWQVFRSHLVERVYEESGGSAEELYSLAGEVIGTYDRQLETVDDYMVLEREDKVKAQRAAMGLPAEKNISEQQDEEEEEANEDDEEGANEDDEEEAKEDDEEEAKEDDEEEAKEDDEEEEAIEDEGDEEGAEEEAGEEENAEQEE